MRGRPIYIALLRSAACLMFVLTGLPCAADQPASRSSVGPAADEVWWTGPLLASAAAALPERGVTIESYVFDSIVRARFDNSGNNRPVDRSESSGSLTELFYGATDTLTLGLIGRFGRLRMSEDTHASRIGLGDCTVQGQYELARQSVNTPATISLVLAETLPAGRFDHLSDRPADGLGTGAHTTTLALYSQRQVVMPSERPLRSRLNVSYSFSTRVQIQDASIYGTTDGFRGEAKPGAVIEFDWAAEYSVSRHWVSAIDIDYLHGASTPIRGVNARASSAGESSATVENRLGSTTTFSLAPAIEYNLSGDLGIIAGIIIPVRGRNASSALTPTLALNVSF
jgi:hypothetical protein